MDPLEEFADRLFRLLTDSERRRQGSIIKRHSERLQEAEYSFPYGLAPWIKYANPSANLSAAKHVFHIRYGDAKAESVDDYFELLVADTASWPIRVSECELKKGRVFVRVDRLSATRLCFVGFPVFACPDVGELKSRIRAAESSEDDITERRLALCRLVLDRVLFYIDSFNDRHRIVDRPVADDFELSLKSNSRDAVLVAPVLNEVGIKERELTASEYLSKRIADVEQIALHRYGLRADDRDRWTESCRNVGRAAVTFDLLENRPNRPVSVDGEGLSFGSNRGAAFVMYNYARLRKIMNTFDEDSAAGRYPPAPPVGEIDFSLLKDEDEWNLIFNFILPHRSPIWNCVEKRSRISSHHLCAFLSSLSDRFSVYYRRIRVLLRSRDHLVPLVHARIRLLMKLREIYDLYFCLLDITPVTRM